MSACLQSNLAGGGPRLDWCRRNRTEKPPCPPWDFESPSSCVRFLMLIWYWRSGLRMAHRWKRTTFLLHMRSCHYTKYWRQHLMNWSSCSSWYPIVGKFFVVVCMCVLGSRAPVSDCWFVETPLQGTIRCRSAFVMVSYDIDCSIHFGPQDCQPIDALLQCNGDIEAVRNYRIV